MKLINLLPKEKQQELLDKKFLRVLVIMIWLSIFGFLLVLLTQFGVRTYLNSIELSVKSNIENLKISANKEENAKIKTQIKSLNDIIVDYRNLSGSIPKLSKVIRQFAPLVPSEVKISSFVLDANKKTIVINGISPTRELVIELYENIVNAKSDFPDIDYPLENVARPTNINFHFSFNVSPELLK